MAMHGPHPKPTEIKRAEGEPDRDRGRRPYNENEPAPDRGIPDPPLFLTPEAIVHWNRIAPILDKARILTTADGEAFGALCESLARYYRAEKRLHEEGEIIYSSKKSRAARPYQNPWLTVSREALSRVLSLGTEFGMTPSSRVRIKVPPAAGADDPINLYLGGARAGEDPPAEEETPAS